MRGQACTFPRFGIVVAPAPRSRSPDECRSGSSATRVRVYAARSRPSRVVCSMVTRTSASRAKPPRSSTRRVPHLIRARVLRASVSEPLPQGSDASMWPRRVMGRGARRGTPGTCPSPERCGVVEESSGADSSQPLQSSMPMSHEPWPGFRWSTVCSSRSPSRTRSGARSRRGVQPGDDVSRAGGGDQPGDETSTVTSVV